MYIMDPKKTYCKKVFQDTPTSQSAKKICNFFFAALTACIKETRNKVD